MSTVSSLMFTRVLTGGDPLTVVALLYALGRGISLIGTVSPPTVDPVAVSIEVGVSPSLSPRWALSSP